MKSDNHTQGGTCYPVVVVGAGPTGLMLANLLGTYGIRTLVLERNSSTVQEPRAVSIDDESLRTIQAVGLDEEVCGQCAMDYGSVYLDLKRRPFASIRPTTREYGFPRRNAFIQPRLEATLRRGLDRFPHVDARFGHRVTGVSQDAQRVRLTVAHDAEQYVVECAYLAAADGGRSFVRGALGIALEGLTYEQKWLIVDLVGTRDRYRQTRVYCDPRRPGINLPGPDGSRRFEFMLLPGETDEQVTDEAFVRRLLADHGPDEGAEIVRKRVYTFHARSAERWRVGRIFLLGDAAHLTPPFAGQGMNSGLRDSANLAWKLAWVINDRLDDAVLDSYEEERKPHAWQLIEMAAMLGDFMMPPSVISAWLRQTGLRILSLYKPARDYVTQMRYKPTPRFLSGWFIPDGLSPKRTRAGRMIAQPRVELADRRINRLDDYIGSAFCLLAYGSDPERAFGWLQPWADRLPSSIRRICITPRDFNAVQHPCCEVVRDLGGEAHEFVFNGCEDAVFLLRPDRYVMAVITAANVATAMPAVTGMLSPPARPPASGDDGHASYRNKSVA